MSDHDSPSPIETAELAALRKEVAELRRTRAQLAESEEKLSRTFQACPDSIAITRLRDGLVLDANESALRTLQIEREGLVGKSTVELQGWVDPADRDAFVTALRARGECLNFETRFRRNNDEIFPAILSAKTLQIGGELCVISVTKDVTQLKLAEAERSALAEQMRRRQHMDSLGTLASGIAHDFQNLLTVIMGNVGLLARQPTGLSPRQRNQLEAAARACRRAADLVDQFQVLSHTPTGQRTTVDVHDAASEVFGLLQATTDRLVEKRIAFEPVQFFVSADPSHLNQVILNLATNAMHAIAARGARPGDRVAIDARPAVIADGEHPVLAPGDYVHLTFEDTGVGMSEAVRQRAFDPLFTTRRKGRQKGQGLGLAMVYRIVTGILQGDILLESTPGEGTVVHLWLPRAEPESTRGAREPVSATGGDETILLVDDEEAIVDVCADLLREHGYTVLSAPDGLAAWELLLERHERGDPLDAVVLDLIMPRMGGAELFARLRALDPTLRLIVFSGQSEEQSPAHVLESADGTIPKPVEVDQLLILLREVLDRPRPLPDDAAIPDPTRT